MDTNVIIAYIDVKDPNHKKAKKLLGRLKRKVTSKLALVEMASVYSRAGIEDPVAVAIYSVEKAGVEIVDVDFNNMLTVALELSSVTKLRTLDLLHVTACKLIGAKRFVTFDEDIVAKLSDVKEKLGIEAVSDSKTVTE
ncbi:MAG: type II toxin-antitoxin system VapC family toxin [Candidatus Baldrarchaeia archaeon]